jgi:hypothetical protein
MQIHPPISLRRCCSTTTTPTWTPWCMGCPARPRWSPAPPPAASSRRQQQRQQRRTSQWPRRRTPRAVGRRRRWKRPRRWRRRPSPRPWSRTPQQAAQRKPQLRMWLLRGRRRRRAAGAAGAPPRLWRRRRRSRAWVRCYFWGGAWQGDLMHMHAHIRLHACTHACMGQPPASCMRPHAINTPRATPATPQTPGNKRSSRSCARRIMKLDSDSDSDAPSDDDSPPKPKRGKKEDSDYDAVGLPWACMREGWARMRGASCSMHQHMRCMQSHMHPINKTNLSAPRNRPQPASPATLPAAARRATTPPLSSARRRATTAPLRQRRRAGRGAAGRLPRGG